MLTRKTFVHAIENIKKHEEVMDRLNAPLNEISEFPVDLDFSKFHREALLDVLHEAMNDTEDLIGSMKMLRRSLHGRRMARKSSMT